MKFVPGILPLNSSDKPALWFAFCGDKLLLETTNQKYSLPKLQDLSSLKPLRRHYFGALDEIPCYAAELSPAAPAPGGTAFIGLRQVFELLGEDLFAMAGRAKQILEWDKTHQYCGQCGSPMRQKSDERAKECPKCGLLNYPRIAPAIIAAITKGDEILLARGTRFAAPMYSVLAGFVEAGETLEECLRREVMEEVGIEVQNIKYFGSQSWPFPHSLMVGFTAEYASGEIRVDPSEIVDAHWFKRDNLPLLPDRLSIARRLIDSFVQRA